MARLDVAFVRKGNNIARAQYARECAVVVGDHFLIFRRTKCRIAGRFVGEAIDGIMHMPTVIRIRGRSKAGW